MGGGEGGGGQGGLAGSCGCLLGKGRILSLPSTDYCRAGKAPLEDEPEVAARYEWCF